jgi:hypothetical protein
VAVACLERLTLPIHDKTADAIDLGLDDEPLRIRDRRAKGVKPVVRDELRGDGREHGAIVTRRGFEPA